MDYWAASGTVLSVRSVKFNLSSSLNWPAFDIDSQQILLG